MILMNLLHDVTFTGDMNAHRAIKTSTSMELPGVVIARSIPV
jgi:hypothetical protein